ncbi:AEC family transporter [Actinotalea sp. Marseille-Q4924]|uniref:AEC family transporter n=1 Tax=Actinotalea sp. Marseille-Q4924 TaxID=2866571 RepID=UPI001CE40265|nr:AEC family transporter [Actinotalea sp. Marseille-Q4924]
MTGVLGALGAMAAIAAVGWLLGRTGLLGRHADEALARVVFVVAAPALLVVTIAHADLHLLLSRVALVTAASTAVVALTAVLVLRGVWRHPVDEAALGVLAASYLNAANVGIPVAVYVLGDAVAVVPTLLFQLLVLAPITFTILETTRARGARPVGPGSATADAPSAARAVVGRTARNPIIIAAVVGLLLAALPWDLPEVVYEPFRIVGAAAAPLALLAFGMSLSAPRVEEHRMLTRELALVTVLRSVVHPALAFGLGTLVGLEGPALLAVTTMAALPTAQNVLVYALHYGAGRTVARDAGLTTTVLAVPAVLVVAATLG